MRNLKEITNDYLSIQTEFAIQIVGNWGCGKTYFYRNVLHQLISEKPTYDDEKKKYKPIYVSLFGLKSVEDIATKIVVDFFHSKLFNTYLKKNRRKKQLNITQSVLKMGLRGFLNLQRLGNLDDYLTDLKIVGKNVLDTNELVIVFDDLERKDTSLKIEDLIGYINSLIDEGIKVFIISNDDILSKNEEQYKNLKEKIIGISIEFIPDIEDTIKSIMDLRYKSFPDYFEYLYGNIEDLVALSRAANNNFRHIIYALDRLHHCYSEIKNNIIDANLDIKEKVLEELRNINIFAFIFAIEYKASVLKYSDISEYRGDLLALSDIFSDNPTVENKKTEEPNKLEKLLKKYQISNEKYFFYESIYSYVTGYDEFNIEKFRVEFAKNFNLEKGQVLPQYEILNLLGYQNCFSLNDEDYKRLTLSAIEHASLGEYAPSDYLSVMHFAERFDNVLKLNLNSVKDKLLIGLKSVIEKNQANSLSFSQFEMSGQVSEISAINRELYDEGMRAIDAFRKKLEEEKIKKLGDFLIEDPYQFESQYKNERDFRFNLCRYPFLNYIKPEMLLNSITKVDGRILFFLEQFFKDRYKNSGLLEQEFDHFNRFAELLIEFNNSPSNIEGFKIKKYLFDKLADTFNAIKEGHDDPKK